MKLFKNNFLDIIKILFKIALNIPKLFYIKLKIYFSIYKKPKTTIIIIEYIEISIKMAKLKFMRTLILPPNKELVIY